MTKKWTYYNEHDPKAAAWIRQLIKNGDISPGEVDERSIIEVQGSDVKGFSRAHWFSGIATWDYCLNQAGWGDKPIFTASLPCQPFSTAGKQLGKSDERHLLPHFLELVRQCKPYCIIGEQVAAAIPHGWLDDLHDEMESQGYAVGSSVLTAAGAGKPHIRQRLYWVAHLQGERCYGRQDSTEQAGRNVIETGCADSWMGDPNDNRCESRSETATPTRYWNTVDSASGDGIGRLGDTEHDGCSASEIAGSDAEAILSSTEGQDYSGKLEGASTPGTVPESIDLLYCRDNKYRPIKRGINPLVRSVKRGSFEVANGSTGGVVHSSDTSASIDPNDSPEARAMRLKGYGNAIVADVGILFIRSLMSII